MSAQPVVQYEEVDDDLVVDDGASCGGAGRYDYASIDDAPPLHRTVARMAIIQGYGQMTRIAKAIGHSTSMVKNILSHPVIAEHVAALRQAKAEEIADQFEQFGRLVPKAIEAVNQALQSTDENVTLRAATIVFKHDPLHSFAEETRVKSQHIHRHGLIDDSADTMRDAREEVKENFRKRAAKRVEAHTAVSLPDPSGAVLDVVAVEP